MAARTATPPAAQAEEPKKKGKAKFLIIGLVVVIAAAAAYLFVLKKPAASVKSAKTAAELASVSYTMPTITTNLNDGHIVQAQMILELAPGDTKAEVAKELPELNNAAILTFGSMTYSQLLPTTGRTQAAATLANAFNTVLHAGHKPFATVESILFASFIVQ
jgi:flagellar FliL protein